MTGTTLTRNLHFWTEHGAKAEAPVSKIEMEVSESFIFVEY
jgi:hypothetical protein